MHVPYSLCSAAALKVLIDTYKLRAFALPLYMREQSEQLQITLRVTTLILKPITSAQPMPI